MTYVAVPEGDPARVMGYYSITPSEVKFEDAPEELTRRLGAYAVPAIRLARLAVDLEFQGRGLGQALLFAAAHRVLQAARLAGGIVVVIDAKDGRAAEWYGRFGAVPLSSKPLTLTIALDTLAEAARHVDSEPGE